MSMTNKELKTILSLHKKWLYRKVNGLRADLRGADLRGANLRRANLRGADLRGANLGGANLGGADFGGADFGGADFGGADFGGADFGGADLRGADLRGVLNLSLPIRCPEEGSFIGFKKVREKYIVKLLILEDARRSSATTNKCRCDKAKVLSITDIEGHVLDTCPTKVYSYYDPNFVYQIGEIVSVDNFDGNRWNECAPGIHFFLTREEAVNYIF